MLDTHLSAEQVQRYQRYALAPDEIVAVYAHLEDCDACRARIDAAFAALSSSALATDLLLETLHEPEHLSDTQLAELVDGLLETADREIALSHLEICASCRTEAAQIQALRTLLHASPQEEFAPLPAVSAPLPNTVGVPPLEVNTAMGSEVSPLPRTEERTHTFNVSWEEHRARFQEALRLLLPRQAAFAAPLTTGNASWECLLPVADNGLLVQGLIGRLFAREAAFYLVVTAQGYAQQRYANRLFQLPFAYVGAEKSDASVAIELEEVVLIGIDLDLTIFLETEAIPIITVFPEI